MSDLLIACDQVVATKDEIQEVISKKELTQLLIQIQPLLQILLVILR